MNKHVQQFQKQANGSAINQHVYAYAYVESVLQWVGLSEYAVQTFPTQTLV